MRRKACGSRLALSAGWCCSALRLRHRRQRQRRGSARRKARAASDQAARSRSTWHATSTSSIRRSPTTGLSWQIEYATCVQAAQLPGQGGAAGKVLQPGGRVRAADRLADGKTYTFTVKAGVQVQRRRAGHRAELRVRDQPRPEPDDAVAGGAVHHRHRRRAGRRQQDGQARSSGIKVKGNSSSITLTQPTATSSPKLAMPFFCAIPKTTRRSTRRASTTYRRLPARTTSRAAPGTARSILKRNPYYKGPRPHNVDHDRLHDRTLDLNQSLLRGQERASSTTTDGLRPAPTALTQFGQQYGVNKSAVLRQSAAARPTTSR